ncbi:siderophore ABC transporter substrate-binding protein [Flavobacterium sp. JP2137]|uniref:siderophore ABC transporter substrate-binding protein n=1 Tax=Flavobacterium sp. JP2137 TaxID=3414510 RepID=UPI003D2FDE6F
MRKIILSGLLLAFFMTTACKDKVADNAATEQLAPAETLVITHQLGTTEVVKNPKKVVLLSYGIIDSFDKLSIKIAGLPKANLPGYLSKYAEDDSIVDIGNLMDPNFEKINELGPDLIVISARQSKLYDELSKIAPTIYLDIDKDDYLGSFEKNARQLGVLFDKEAEVEKDLAAINTKIANIKTITEKSDKTGLIVLINEGRYSAYGKGSRFGIIHDVFGVKPADQNIEVATHGQSVSNEFIQKINPDYLFVIDRGAAIKKNELNKEAFSNALIERTKAYKTDKIIFLSPDVWYLSGGGLESVSMMVDEIERAIQ